MLWKKCLILFLSVITSVSFWQLEENFSVTKFENYPNYTLENGRRAAFSPDGTSFAFVTLNKEGKMIIVKDGKEIDTCDLQKNPVYSPDSKSFAFYCRTWDNYSGTYSIINNAKISEQYSNIDDGSITYSPDSKSLSFSIFKDDWGEYSKKYLVKDGEEFGPYDELNSIWHSEDSTNFAFSARRGEEYLIVKNGKEIVVDGDTASSIAPHFSEDDNRFAYWYKKNNKHILVVDGVESSPYEDVYASNFLSGENGFVFIGQKGGKDYLVIQSNKKWREVWPYDKISWAGYTYKTSSNFKHFVYLAEKDGKKIALIDGKPSKPYDQIPEFLMLSRLYSEEPEWRFYYNIPQFIYSKTGEDLVFSARKGNKEILVKNGVEIDKYDRAYSPQLSSDGKNFLFLAEKNGQTILVKNDIEIPLNGYHNSPPHGFNGILISPDDSKYALLLISGIEENKVVLLESAMENNDISLMKRMPYDKIKSTIYSTVSNKLMFIGTDGEESFIVQDWKRSEWYNSIEQLMFSENIESFAFAANNAEKKFLVQYIHKISLPSPSAEEAIIEEEVPAEPLNAPQESENWLENATYVQTGPLINVLIIVSLICSLWFFYTRKKG